MEKKIKYKATLSGDTCEICEKKSHFLTSLNGYDLIIATKNINEANDFKSQFHCHPDWTKITSALCLVPHRNFTGSCNSSARGVF